MANNSKKAAQDLGLGEKVIQENRTRYVNRDGSFNVHRKGVWETGSFSPYHAILNISWPRFYFGVFAYYVLANLVFTSLYFFSGEKAFPQIAELGAQARFGELFFYSVQVITTLGSSPLHPANFRSEVVLAIEAMVGMLGFALGASLMFARFSNPAPGIIFSRKAVISPYQGVTGFMFRIINNRSHELVQVGAVVTLAITGKDGKRSFQQLGLERDNVLVLPLHWTIVHPIDKNSPLYGLNAQDLSKANAEFVVSVTAVDQDLSKMVYTRTSYRFNEVVMNARFSNIIEHNAQGTVVVDPKRIHEIEKL